MTREDVSGDGPRTAPAACKEDPMSTKHGPKTKGTESAGSKGKGKRVATASPAPEAVVTEATGEAVEVETPFDDPVPEVPAQDAPVEVAATAPAPKRKRDLTIDDLRAEYARVTGQETTSSNRSYAEQTIMRSSTALA
jgi:hypothetical protein